MRYIIFSVITSMGALAKAIASGTEVVNNLSVSTFLHVLWQRKWIVLLTTLAALGATAWRVSTMTPQYVASATLRVATAVIGSSDYVQYDVTYADRLMNTYKEVAAGSSFLQRVVDELDLSSWPTVSIDSIVDTELLNIHIQHENPQVATSVANALARNLAEYAEASGSSREMAAALALATELERLEAAVAESRTQYIELASLYADTDERVFAANREMTLQEQSYTSLRERYEGLRAGEAIRASSLTVVAPANVPTLPVSPNVPLSLGLATVTGLIVGLGIALVIESSDTTLRSTRAIQQVVPTDVLGAIPAGNISHLLTFSNDNSIQAEAYRSLRTNLFGSHTDADLRSVVFTSAIPHEGKSTVVANLAIAIAKSGRRVIAVDCDFRRPTLDKLFDIRNEVGLVHLLQGEIQPVNVMTKTDYPELYVIPTGHPLPANPAELLMSLPLAKVLEELLKHADIVLIDAPALGPVTDAAVIAPLVDAAVLVVGRGRVKEADVQLAYRRLTQVKAKNVGIIVNRAERTARYMP